MYVIIINVNILYMFVVADSYHIPDSWLFRHLKLTKENNKKLFNKRHRVAKERKKSICQCCYLFLNLGLRFENSFVAIFRTKWGF